MKKLVLSFLIFLSIFFCSFTSFSEEKLNYFIEEYSGFQLYESPFNPHVTLRFWPVLSNSALSPDILYIRVGSPKINWLKEKEYSEKEMDKLNVEILSVHYGFLIEVDKEGKRHLTLIIYIWKNQVTGRVYRCSAKPDEMMYKIEEIKNKDKMEVNIKRFFNDFRYLQIAWY
jgi:hypothetical protein